MNVLDSELVVAALRKNGYELVDSPAKADTILFNTCSVRQHAEDKIYSALGRLKHAKTEAPHKIIGVLGCMAQKDQQLIFQRAPYVDLIVGPGQLHQVPRLLEEIAAGSGPRLEVSLDRKAGSREEIERSFESYDPDRDPTMRPSPYQAYVRIQFGCDKFCTYCIVPRVRGPEQGRHPDHIVAEAKKLADEGCREITLLGQTVNSYRHTDGDRTTRLSDLLYRLHEIAGLARLKFVTNFPKDMTDDLLQAVRDLPKCSPYLHVPAQSGSNAVLKRMKRGYTVEEYREMMTRIRSTIPDCRRHERFHRRLLRRDRRRFSTDRRSGPRVALQKQLHLQIQRAARHESPRHVARRCAGRSKTPPQQRTVGRAKPDQRGRQSHIHRPHRRSTDRRAEQAFAEVERTDEPCRRRSASITITPSHNSSAALPAIESWCSKATAAKSAKFCPIAIYDCTPMTLFGSVVTQEIGPEVYSLVMNLHVPVSPRLNA